MFIMNGSVEQTAVLCWVYFCVSNLFDMLFFLSWLSPNELLFLLLKSRYCMQVEHFGSFVFFSFTAIHVVRIRELKIDTLDNKQHRKLFMEWLWFPLRFTPPHSNGWNTNRYNEYVFGSLFCFCYFSFSIPQCSYALNRPSMWTSRCRLYGFFCVWY